MILPARFYLFYIASLTALAGPAFAQAVEAVPLSAPSYTLKSETDPMAMDPGATPPENSVNRGEVQIAPPPPGADDQPATTGSMGGDASSYGGSAYETTPSPITPPADFSPSGEAPRAAPSAMDAERMNEAYPNNAVTGVIRTDESKFENRTFCTLKISFGSIGTGIDHATAGKIKTYLDSHPEKLSYKKSTWGKEGEFDFCIDIPAHNNRARIYTDLKKLLPPKDTRDKRTVLSGKGFTQVENSY